MLWSNLLNKMLMSFGARYALPSNDFIISSVDVSYSKVTFFFIGLLMDCFGSGFD